MKNFPYSVTVFICLLLLSTVSAEAKTSFSVQPKSDKNTHSVLEPHKSRDMHLFGTYIGTGCAVFSGVVKYEYNGGTSLSPQWSVITSPVNNWVRIQNGETLELTSNLGPENKVRNPDTSQVVYTELANPLAPSPYLSQASSAPNANHNPRTNIQLSNPSSPDKLFPGEELKLGRALTSSDGKYSFVLQTDGNLVVYKTGSNALWSSKTNGKNVFAAQLQTDGNFVIYDTNTKPVWKTDTANKAVSYLIVQPDGNVVIYDQNHQPLWKTDTMQPQ